MMSCFFNFRQLKFAGVIVIDLTIKIISFLFLLKVFITRL